MRVFRELSGCNSVARSYRSARHGVTSSAASDFSRLIGPALWSAALPWPWLRILETGDGGVELLASFGLAERRDGIGVCLAEVLHSAQGIRLALLVLFHWCLRNERGT